MKPYYLELSREEHELGPRVLFQDKVRDTFPAHYHNFYEIFLITDGRAIHNVNGSQQFLSKGSLVFIRPDDVHSYTPINQYEFKILSFGFLMEDITTILTYLGISHSVLDMTPLPIHLKVEDDQLENMQRLLLKLASMYPSEECFFFFRSFISEILYLLINPEADFAHQNSLLIPDWLQKLNNQMSKRENYIQGVPRLMELANYSQNHVIRSFKRYYGMTPTEYVNHRRLAYASELILSNKYSILEVCHLSGFNNLSNFYSIFHNVYHCTPKKFYKQYEYSK
jgi:AraC family cel operon transcriptional repressor